MALDLQKHSLRTTQAHPLSSAQQVPNYAEPELIVHTKKKSAVTVAHSLQKLSKKEEILSCAIENQAPSLSSETLLLDSKIYALKKRLLAPTWWVEGLILNLGSKEAWYQEMLESCQGRLIAAPSEMNTKNVVPMFSIWHEIISKVLIHQTNSCAVRIHLNKFVSGTQAEIQIICKQLELAWASPLHLYSIKRSKRSKGLSLSKCGNLNFVKFAQIQFDVDGVWLQLNFSQSLFNFIHPTEVQPTNSACQLTSINPVVIQAMGGKITVKKILSYLFLEYSKKANLYDGINSSYFNVTSEKLSLLHKDMIANASSLYDHGILGWIVSSPTQRIKELKARLKSESTVLKTDALCSWCLSEQVREAFEVEHSLSQKLIDYHPSVVDSTKQEILSEFKETESINAILHHNKVTKTLFPEPPEDELRKIRLQKEKDQKQELAAIIKKANVLKRQNLEDSIIATEEKHEKSALKRERIKKADLPSLFENTNAIVTNPFFMVTNKSSERSNTTTQHKSIESLNDHEFIILLSEFYESLKTLQKRAFERDRKSMSPEQFREYMGAILLRNKQIK